MQNFYSNSGEVSKVVAGDGPLTVSVTGNQYTVSHDLSSIVAGTYGDSSNYTQIVVDQYGIVTGVEQFPLALGTTPIWYPKAGLGLTLGTLGGVVTFDSTDFGSTSLDKASAVAWGGTKLDSSVAVAWGGTKQNTIGFLAVGNNSLGTAGNVLTLSSNTFMTAGTARIGDDVHYTEFQTNGQRLARGTATMWNDLVCPLLAASSGNKEPVLTTYGSSGVLKVRAFENSTGVSIDEIFGSIEMMHDWKEESMVYPHIHWTPLDNTAGTVVFQMNYALTALAGVTTPPEEGSLEFHAVCLANRQYNPHFANSAAPLDMTGYHIGSQLIFRLFRDGNHINDTYTNGAGVVTLGLHYECDGDGSRHISTK